MKILLDECVDRRFASVLAGHIVMTVPQMGWAGVKNGELMRLAETEFDAFVTVDRNLSFQQNVSEFSISVIVLRAKSNRFVDLEPYAVPLLKALITSEKGTVTLITG